jgi:Ran GTPase-activating protein (RanGAP) involved in mRNA processing and transport
VYRNKLERKHRRIEDEFSIMFLQTDGPNDDLINAPLVISLQDIRRASMASSPTSGSPKALEEDEESASASHSAAPKGISFDDLSLSEKSPAVTFKKVPQSPISETQSPGASSDSGQGESPVRASDGKPKPMLKRQTSLGTRKSLFNVTQAAKSVVGHGRASLMPKRSGKAGDIPNLRVSESIAESEDNESKTAEMEELKDPNDEESGKISSADLDYVGKLARDMNQTIIFSDRIRLITGTEKKGRLLVLTTFRLITVRKDHVKGRVVRHNFHLLDLVEVSLQNDSSPDSKILIIAFQAETIKEEIRVSCSEAQAKLIVLKMLECNANIVHFLSHERKPTFNVPSEYTSEFKPPQVGVLDKATAISSYHAVCDYVGVRPRSRVTQYLQLCWDKHNSEFDLNKLFKDASRIEDMDLYAATWSVRYNSIFKSIQSRGVSIGDGGVNALGMLFTPSSVIEALAIIDGRVTSKGVYSLSKHIERMCSEMKASGTRPVLKMLDLSKNKIADDGLLYLLEGIKESIHLTHLKLSDCAITNKGLVSLFRLLERDSWLRTLQELDLSHNEFGSVGSKCVALYVEKCKALQSLNLASTDLNLKVFLQSLCLNKNLCQEVLQCLDISGNKLPGATSLLAVLLGMTRSLETVILADTKLAKATLQEVLEGLFSNPNETHFHLDLSNNALDTGLGKAMSRALKTVKKAVAVNIKFLNVDNCKLGSEGFQLACEAISLVPSIEVLKFDRNFSAGLAKMANQFGPVLVNCLKHLKRLRVLSLQGGDGTSFTPIMGQILDFVSTHKSIFSLDVSNNQMTSECWKWLSDAVLNNEDLRFLNIDGNWDSIKTFKSFQEALTQNISVLGVLPVNDIQQALSIKKQETEVQQVAKALCIHYKRNRLTEDFKTPEELLAYENVACFSSVKEELLDLVDEKEASALQPSRRNQFSSRIARMETVVLPGYTSPIPSVLVAMKDYLLANGGTQSVGIFRLTPDKNEVENVKTELNEKTFQRVNDINAISHLIKQWFKDCPDKILAELPTKDFTAFAKSKDAMIQSYNLISEPRRSIYFWLLDLCVAISHFSEVNLMGPKNLAIVFAPNLHPFDNLDQLQGLRASEELGAYMTLGITHRAETHPFDNANIKPQ